jgi:hypothetical protein
MNTLIAGHQQWYVSIHHVFSPTHYEQMKGEEHAALEKLPNHRLFSADKRLISPVLQCRMDATKNSGTVTAPPIFNITIGKEITDLFWPPLHAPTTVTASGSGSTLASPLLPNVPELSNLLPLSGAPGIDMLLTEFCTFYDLSPGILEKLTNNDYKMAHILRFVKLQGSVMQLNHGRCLAFDFYLLFFLANLLSQLPSLFIRCFLFPHTLYTLSHCSIFPPTLNAYML